MVGLVFAMIRSMPPAIIHTGSNHYLLETTDCEAQKKTAEACAEKMIAAIELCDRKFGKQVQ